MAAESLEDLEAEMVAGASVAIKSLMQTMKDNENTSEERRKASETYMAILQSISQVNAVNRANERVSAGQAQFNKLPKKQRVGKLKQLLKAAETST